MFWQRTNYSLCQEARVEKRLSASPSNRTHGLRHKYFSLKITRIFLFYLMKSKYVMKCKTNKFVIIFQEFEGMCIHYIWVRLHFCICSDCNKEYSFPSVQFQMHPWMSWEWTPFLLNQSGCPVLTAQSAWSLASHRRVLRRCADFTNGY